MSSPGCLTAIPSQIVSMLGVLVIFPFPRDVFIEAAVSASTPMISTSGLFSLMAIAIPEESRLSLLVWLLFLLLVAGLVFQIRWFLVRL